MERLVISQDHRHLEPENGGDFFWLADTVWVLPTKINWQDAIYLMDKRVQQGFTVLQVAALGPDGMDRMYNPSGEPAFFNELLDQPNECYFRYLDWLLDRAMERNLYVLLLPVWEQMVIGENWGGKKYKKILNEKSAYDYGLWIGNRYKQQKNIIWCLGGDCHPIYKGTDYKNVWRRLAEGIGKGVTGKDLKWDVPDPDWSRALMTYHPCYEPETGLHSTMSYWTDEDVWIDFIMNQSGHGDKTQNYIQIKKDYERENIKPVFDGEPAYEAMPTGWPGDFPLHDAWMVRKRAYWSLFSGAFGHTYGHACVWSGISEREKEGYPCTWYEALDYPGAWNMRVLKDFITSRPFRNVVPCQEMIRHCRVCKDGCLDDHRQACVDKDRRFAFVYLSSGGTETVDLSVLTPKELNVWWFDPKTGGCASSRKAAVNKTEVIPNDKSWKVFTAPEQGEDKDWILVLEDPSFGWDAPGLPLETVRAGFKTELAKREKVFQWQD